MDEKLQALFVADFGKSIARQRDDVDLATARQRDGAAQDMRVVGGFIAGELFRTDDPAQFAGLNAGVRIPTTLDHPGNPVKA